MPCHAAELHGMQRATYGLAMVYVVSTCVLSFLLDLVTTARMAEHEKDLELLLLRQQLRILQRKVAHSPRISRWEKLSLAVLVAKLVRLPTGARAR